MPALVPTRTKCGRLKLSKERIDRLGYFTNTDVTTVPVPGTTDEVDVNVKVEEKPTGAITLGAGYDSSDKVVLSAGVSQENVFGSGTTLAVNVNTAQTYRTLSVTQTDPYFTIDGIKRIVELSGDQERFRQPRQIELKADVVWGVAQIVQSRAQKGDAFRSSTVLRQHPSAHG